ncbi:MAG TPA: rhomboid family intramembrane serine protease [Blastocatellia bacterium]|nr:rhomboid family intramembrane serine protease [Blastocatellia bacterium]
MWLDGIFFIALVIVLVIQSIFTFVPLGNERSTVRRLPWVTFAIMAICVVAYYVTLPSTVSQDRELMKARTNLYEFLSDNRSILADDEVRRKVRELGLISEEESEEISKEMKGDLDSEYRTQAWLRSAEGRKVKDEFDLKFAECKTATESHLYFKYGLAPNGTWKAHQLITAVFLHGSTLHLFGNLLFFFAVGFSLEDLWGRGVFLGFYLLAGVAASLPELVNPGPLPSIGASGAIAGTMGAFLVRLYDTKVKIGWVTLPLSIPFMLFGRKPYGVINVAAYIYLPFYFISQILPWWFIKKTGLVSTIGYSAHIAGFVFGVGFALVMKAMRVEERYINPKIEARVSFSASPAVTQSLEMLDRGEAELAERKLKSYLAKQPDDINAVLALIQVYQRTEKYDQLNSLYGNVIRHHLANEDREAALYAYDSLLSAFPDNQVNPKIPARDWIVICEYLQEAQMNREAAVEYERLAKAWADDPLAVRACVQGGEAALLAHDNQRALKLFEIARDSAPSSLYSGRIEAGIEKAKLRLNHRPSWVKKGPRPQPVIK